jgi:hypothetical protein
MEIHGKEYTEVKDRLRLLYGHKDRVFPRSYIVTEVVHTSPDMSAILIKATVYPNETDDDKRYFTGLAFESKDSNLTNVNYSSWIENCETSAIGRALANMDIGVSEDGKRPSKEEMRRPERLREQPDKGAVVKKIEPIKKREGLRELYVRSKQILGSDFAYQQMVENRKMKDPLNSSEPVDVQILEEMREAFAGFLVSIEEILKTDYNTGSVTKLTGDDRIKFDTMLKGMVLFL